MIDMINPENTKFIARKCTELHCSKDMVIGLYNQYSWDYFQIYNATDDYEKVFHSEVFYFDP